MRLLALVVSLLLLAGGAARSVDGASPDDTARFLAGLPPAAGSPLAALAQDRSWQNHAAAFNASFGRFEARQVARIRAWSSANLQTKRPVLLYMFSGPDFLYANAFFPDAATYVLAGLEPVGDVPDLAKVPRPAIPRVLGNLQLSLRTVLNVSFFRTIDMKTDMRASPINGTLPVIYVFLARSGKTIREASRLHLGEGGEVLAGARPPGKTGADGAKIVFAGPDGREQTLYYFSANVANDGFKASGIGPFARGLGPANSFVKSASYLMHSGGFSQVRDMLLERSSAILQDDTGIPVGLLDPRRWELRPHGRYLGPIKLFASSNQPKLREVFRKAPPIDFGVGYRWRPNESNLLLAVKRDGPPTQ